MSRPADVAAGLASVERRIAAACAAAGRPRPEVTLIVVTKFFPAADIRLLAGLGVTDVGESRDREAAAKAAECADLGLRWHFVGQLQTNKAASVARYAGCVHSVDRPRLVDALAAATDPTRPLPCLVQVDLDAAATSRGRGGARPADVARLAARIAAAPGLSFGGVMAIAPLGADPATSFEELVRICARLRVAHPGATVVSAGMSGDLEAAVAAGATHLRVGTAVLGSRPPNR